jgi:acyl-CoA reductase-like NAD-dependent aldehyde dehydrogenase
MDESTISDIAHIQRNFFREGKTRSISFRIMQLKILKRAIRQNEDRILEALWADLRKPPLEGYGAEIAFSIREINHAIRNLRAWANPAKVPTDLIDFPAASSVYSEPLGVVLIIGPWNYPFQLLFAPLVGAIAAGNCAILKPSEISPNSSRVIARIIKENFAPSFLAVVEGGPQETQTLLSFGFDHIFFTGGTSIGKLVMKAASEHLTPVTLELGGKSPCIVDKDIKLDYTASRIVWGKFINAGQTCVAPDYLLIHTAIKGQLLERIAMRVREFYGEDPSKSPDYGRIVSDKHFARLCQLLQEGEIIFGGSTNAEDRYIAPTIIDKVTLSNRVMQEEIFGPILPVMDYDDLAQAISIVNQQPKPLSLYFFSKNKMNQERVLSETSSGGVSINDTVSYEVSSSLPFGGVGLSGMGNYHGKASFDTFSHKKAVLKKSLLLDVGIKYPPYKRKLTYVRRLI